MRDFSHSIVSYSNVYYFLILCFSDKPGVRKVCVNCVEYRTSKNSKNVSRKRRLAEDSSQCGNKNLKMTIDSIISTEYYAEIIEAVSLCLKPSNIKRSNFERKLSR